ncbi:MAG: Hpt domain-containing protein [Pseudobacteriovorax sp.]|nr:Hpt domain-containing protein [Pseudobacteriovorax sp.]
MNRYLKPSMLFCLFLQLVSIAKIGSAQERPSPTIIQPKGLTQLAQNWTITSQLFKKDNQAQTWKKIKEDKLDSPITTPIRIGDNAELKTVVRYQIQLENRENVRDLMLWLPNPLGHVDVTVNGENLYKRGQTLDNGFKLGRGDAFIELPQAESYAITIDVDNSGYTPRGAGFYITPVVGTELAVMKKHNGHIQRDYFLLGLISIAMFYHLLLFLLRHENRSTLVFAGFCAAIGFRMLFASDGRILLNSDTVSPFYSYMIENALGVIATSFMVLFPTYIIRGESFWKLRFSRKGARILAMIGICGTLIALVPNAVVSDIGMNIMQVNVLFLILLIIPWLFLATFRGQPQAILVLVGYLSPAVTAVTDISFYFLKIDLQTLPFGTSLFICTQAAMLSVRFNKLFDEVDDLNENLENKVIAKTRDIKSTLDNLPQGVFRIIKDDDNLVVDDEFSRALSDLLGTTDIGGRDPFDLLFERSSLNEVERSGIKTVLDGSLGEDIMQFEVNNHLLPAEFRLDGPILEVDWAPILDQDEMITRILCIVKDVTAMRALQETAQQESRYASIITEIARVKSFAKVNDFLENAATYIKGALVDIDEKHIVFRNLHTLKGLALTFNFKRISNQTHEAESFVQNLPANQMPKAEAKVREKIDAIEEIINEYRKALDGLFANDEGAIPVQKQELMDVGEDVMHGNIKSAVQRIIFLYEYNIAKILETEIQSIAGLAKRLGKEPPKVEIVNDNFVIDTKTSQVIKKSFIHLLRNSMDHGIETARQREKVGKDPIGSITIEVSKWEDYLRLVFSDDGRGLDMEAIKEKAIASGLNPEASPEDLAEVIFQSGVSTATAVTDISGRGVGMEAVKKFIEIEGGHVELKIDDVINGRAKLSFIIDLPFTKDMKEIDSLIA